MVAPITGTDAVDPGVALGGRMRQDETDDGRLDELERYRRAAEDALQQLDWVIGYLHAIRQNREARMLSSNRQTIRRNLLHREEQPTPA
jgi:hypothetical protein